MPFARIVDAIGAASKEGTPKFAFSIAVPEEERGERRDVCGERIVLFFHQEEIQRIVRADFGAVRACYVDALKRDPTAGGRIGIRFVVESDGHVDQVSAENDPAFRDPAATSCILARFRKLQFPKRTFGGTTTVVYPIIFHADDSPAKPAP